MQTVSSACKTELTGFITAAEFHIHGIKCQRLPSIHTWRTVNGKTGHIIRRLTHGTSWEDKLWKTTQHRFLHNQVFTSLKASVIW